MNPFISTGFKLTELSSILKLKISDFEFSFKINNRLCIWPTQKIQVYVCVT